MSIGGHLILSGERLREATRREDGKEYALRAVTGELMGRFPLDFSWDLLDRLIERSYVYGRGSLSNVRHFQMDVDFDEALKMLGVESDRVRRERALSPIDRLRRMCSDRKTIYRDHADVLLNGRVRRVYFFAHKGARS